MIERLGIIVVYFYLTLVNIWGFSKLGIGYEGNFHLKFLFKRIGVRGTQILTVLAVSILVMVMPMDSFFEGIVFGLFFFNVVHDYYTIKGLLKEKKNE